MPASEAPARYLVMVTQYDWWWWSVCESEGEGEGGSVAVAPSPRVGSVRAPPPGRPQRGLPTGWGDVMAREILVKNIQDVATLSSNLL